MSAIKGFGASRGYLYSLHPRNFNSYRSNMNTNVAGFNDRIRARVSEVSSIVYLTYTIFLSTKASLIHISILRQALFEPLRI